MTRNSKEPYPTSTTFAAPADGISFRTLIRRAAWPLAIKALPALYGAGLVLFVIRVLPPSEFGRYGVAFAYINLAAVFTRGLWAIPLVTWAARHEEASVLSPVFWLSLCTALMAGLVAVILLPALDLAGYLPLMSALMLLVLIPRELGYALAQAHGRYKDCFFMELTYFAGSFAFFAGLWSLGQLHSAERALGVNLICAAASSILAVKAYPMLLRLSTRGEWMAVVHYGKWIGALGLAEVYLQQGDALLIGAFVSPAQIAPYLAARTVLRLYGVVSQAINFVVLPAASRLAAAGQLDKLRSRLWQVLRRLLVALVPLNLLLWLTSPILFPFLLGDQYSSAVPFFRILMLATFFEPIYIILGNALAGIGRPSVVFKAVPLAIIVNIAFNVIFLPSMGLPAATYALVASYVILAAQLIWLSKNVFRASMVR